MKEGAKPRHAESACGYRHNGKMDHFTTFGASGRLIPLQACAGILVATALSAACSSQSNDSGRSGSHGGTGAASGIGGDPVLFGNGSSTGTSGTGSGSGASGPGFEACAGLAVEGEQVAVTGPLDIYLVFDRTASMGQDCD